MAGMREHEDMQRLSGHGGDYEVYSIESTPSAKRACPLQHYDSGAIASLARNRRDGPKEDRGWSLVNLVTLAIPTWA